MSNSIDVRLTVTTIYSPENVYLILCSKIAAAILFVCHQPCACNWWTTRIFSQAALLARLTAESGFLPKMCWPRPNDPYSNTLHYHHHRIALQSTLNRTARLPMQPPPPPPTISVMVCMVLVQGKWINIRFKNLYFLTLTKQTVFFSLSLWNMACTFSLRPTRISIRLPDKYIPTATWNFLLEMLQIYTDTVPHLQHLPLYWKIVQLEKSLNFREKKTQTDGKIMRARASFQQDTKQEQSARRGWNAWNGDDEQWLQIHKCILFKIQCIYIFSILFYSLYCQINYYAGFTYNKRTFFRISAALFLVECVRILIDKEKAKRKHIVWNLMARGP